jgi:putative transposase
MARPPRLVVPGYPHHVIVRGVNRQPIFAAEEDREYFLERLSTAVTQFGCAVHCYVLMTNHVHLLITPSEQDGLPGAMHNLGLYYVRYFNRLYERTGTLFEGRYKSCVVDTDRYALACYRYIELNPVRAGLAPTPCAYPWSSHDCNAYGKPDPLVTCNAAYLALGADAPDRQRAYRAFLAQGISDADLQEIRDCTRTSWALGSERFRNELERRIERRCQPKRRGGDRRSAAYRSAAGSIEPGPIERARQIN